jgi:hypothetical protein
MIEKILCNECGWAGMSDEALAAPSPFDPAQKLTGCPRCRGVDFLWGCDEPGCDAEATCGTPTPDGGYRHTCHRHRPPV